MKAIMETKLENLELLHKGKVRDIYQIDGNLLIIATDRISAFDCVFPNGIPGKGKILTQISNKWFDKIDFVKNHILISDFDKFPEELKKYREQLHGRAVIVKKAKRIDFECVVRGYLAGSGWKEYQKSSTICGELLPEGLKESSKLPYPIFTPATKADTGHDINVPFSAMISELGKTLSEQLRRKSIQIYDKAHDALYEKDIILADTKFEFGIIDDEIILIDEILTPDSSRFWPKETYKEGSSSPGFDKQYVRDYVEKINWDKNPPAPELPDDVIDNTLKKYQQIENIIDEI